MNLLGLARGAQAVLPTTFLRYKDGRNKVESVRITTFKATKMKLFSSTVRASGLGSALGIGRKAYNAQIAFFGVEDPANTIPSVANHRCGVRCSCLAYYFWFSYANIKLKCNFGAKFRPYVRKTPVSDPRYKPRNPMGIPGACKHILLLTSTLQQRKEVGP